MFSIVRAPKTTRDSTITPTTTIRRPWAILIGRPRFAVRAVTNRPPAVPRRRCRSRILAIRGDFMNTRSDAVTGSMPIIPPAPRRPPLRPPLSIYYTQSVGYGPYTNGGTLGAVLATQFHRPSALIVATDGVYSGPAVEGPDGPELMWRDSSNAPTALDTGRMARPPTPCSRMATPNLFTRPACPPRPMRGTIPVLIVFS